MEIFTKDGKRVLTLNGYGSDWGMTFVNGGCDEAMIDMGDNSAQEDFFLFLREESDLKEDSINMLEENFFSDKNWAIEVEDGAKEALLENDYVQESQYYFIHKDIKEGERF